MTAEFEVLDTTFGEVPTADQFAALRQALRGSGGIARHDDLARLLEDHRIGHCVSLPGLIANHSVFGFEFKTPAFGKA